MVLKLRGKQTLVHPWITVLWQLSHRRTFKGEDGFRSANFNFSYFTINSLLKKKKAKQKENSEITKFSSYTPFPVAHYLLLTCNCVLVSSRPLTIL